MVSSLPRILIVSRLVWNDKGNSNTLSNIFANYNADKISRIYIESKLPDTTCCNHFYQISEISLVKKLFKWKTRTGQVIRTDISDKNKTNIRNERDEDKVMGFARSHRLPILGFLREILWMLNGWRSAELDQFLKDARPEVLWLDGSPLILMNRLNNYVRKRLPQVPAVTFLMDDVYTYKSCNSIYKRVFRFFLRKHVKRTVKNCQHIFVASPKMKEEYDKLFGINSTVITKSFDFEKIDFSPSASAPHVPIRLVYLGNVLIGRLQTLETIAFEMKKINTDREKIVMDIYTTDHIPEDIRRNFKESGVTVHDPVPYDQTPSIISNADVQVFVEAFEGRAKNIARLSFSTKIIDYLISGKCVLAVGDADLAPIEYFKNEDAAIVATNQDEIRDALEKLMIPEIIEIYAQRAFECGKRNHHKALMDRIIYGTLTDLKNSSLK